jgi:hypothetical protein
MNPYRWTSLVEGNLKLNANFGSNNGFVTFGSNNGFASFGDVVRNSQQDLVILVTASTLPSCGEAKDAEAISCLQGQSCARKMSST